MAANLFGSMVRGFGFTLGRMAAVATVSSFSKGSNTYSPPSPYKTGAIQKLLIVGGWLWSTVHYLKIANSVGHSSYEYGHYSMLSFLCLTLGWLPIWLFFRMFNYFTISSKVKKEKEEKLIKDQEEKNELIPKIESIFLELKTEYPYCSIELTSSTNDFDWDTQKFSIDVDKLKNIHIKFLTLVMTLRSYKNKGYDDDTICNIMNEELWLGMNEEHMKDMKGEPTKTERETMKSGKIRTKHIYGNKTSGDVLVFEEGLLVSFKDR